MTLHTSCCYYSPGFVLENGYTRFSCEGIDEMEKLRNEWRRGLPRLTESGWRRLLHLNEGLEPQTIPRSNGLDAATVKASVSLVEVVGQYVELKQRGRDWWGCCPFSQERTPSFKVNPERGQFYCFSCQEKGDVFSFVQKMEALSFPEALKVLAASV